MRILIAAFFLAFLAGCNEQTPPPNPTPIVVSSNPLPGSPTPTESTPDQAVVVSRSAEGLTTLTARNGARAVELFRDDTNGLSLRLIEQKAGPSGSDLLLTTFYPTQNSVESLKTAGVFLGPGGTYRAPFFLVLEAFINGTFPELQPTEEELAKVKDFLAEVQGLEAPEKP